MTEQEFTEAGRKLAIEAARVGHYMDAIKWHQPTAKEDMCKLLTDAENILGAMMDTCKEYKESLK